MARAMLALAVCLLACGDDDDSGIPDAGDDADIMPSDSSLADATPADSGPDDASEGVDSATDAGPQGEACPLHEDPELEITFPGWNALSEAATTHVAGRVASSAEVMSVTVAGSAARAMDDDLHVWHTETPVALELGDNSIEVVVELAGGEMLTSSVSVRRTTLFASPRDLVWDAAGNRVIVIDTLAIVAIEDGVTSLVAEPIGNGNFSSGRGALDEATRTLYTLMGQQIVSVDLATGAIAVVYTPGMGTGPDLGFVAALAFDANGDRLVAIPREGGSAPVLAVNPTNGNRTVISADTETPAISQSGYAVVGPDGTIYTTEQDRTLISIHPTTGARQMITFSEDLNAGGVAWDSTRDRLIVSDYIADWVWAVDPADGTATRLFRTDPEDRFFGGGESVSQITYDATNDRVLGNDNNDGRVLAVDISTDVDPEERTTTTLSVDQTVGAGPPLLYGEALRMRNRHQVLVAEQIDDRLISIDLTTADRCIAIDRDNVFINPLDFELTSDTEALVSSPGVLFRAHLDTRSVEVVSGSDSVGTEFGSGPAIQDSEPNMAYDATNNRVLMPGEMGVNDLIAIDLTNGARSVIRAADDMPFMFAAGVLLDTAQDRVFVLDPNPNQLWSIQLTDGERTLISEVTSPGVPFRSPQEADFSDEPGSLFVTADRRVLRVDLTTGERSLVSGRTFAGEERGVGPAFRGTVDAVRYDAEANRLFVADHELAALLIIDLETGDRAIASR